jgi:hypothetical protein
VDARAAALFDRPPEEFTKARDVLVKQLRKDGDTNVAAVVKALRRPTVAAWTVNRLAREGALAGVWDAGEKLRAAQREVVGGGEPKALQQAAGVWRKALGEATAGVDASVVDKVRETLEAALADDELRARVREGTLEKEARHAGFGFGEADADVARVSPRVDERAERKAERERAERAAREVRELEEKASRLEAEADAAERHARQLRKQADAARAAADEARSR